MRPSLLAGALCAGGGILTGLAFAQPSPVTIANAVLFVTWSGAAFHAYLLTRTPGARLCLACGATDPLRLPDGSCGACAAPLKKSGWAA